MLHQWRPRLSEFWFSAGSRSFSPTALAARGGDTVMWKVHVLSRLIMIYLIYLSSYLCLFLTVPWTSFFQEWFLGCMFGVMQVFEPVPWLLQGDRWHAFWNCGAWKLSKSWKHFLKDDRSFVGRVKEVWIFHVHDIRTVFSFQVQVVLSNFRKGSLYHGRIQNFPKPFASHRIRQVASEALKYVELQRNVARETQHLVFNHQLWWRR